jgi:NDP-sugar pyrophosphorylase family protein
VGFDSPVQDFMQKHFTWVPPDLGRAVVLDLMKARRFKQIPVLSPDRVLVGLHLLSDLLGMSPRANAALVLCGGLGTRLRPITEKIPKAMIQVAGRPILERLILHLLGHGFRRFILATHYLSEQIEAHFGDGAGLGCAIEYLREERPLGTGGALGLLGGAIPEPVLVVNGDLITRFDAGRMLEDHAASGNRMTVGYSTHIHEIPYGVLAIKDQKVCGWQEKPRMTYPVSAGVYVVDPELRFRVQPRTPTPITWLVEDCLARGERVGVFPVDDEWIDIGRHEELRLARGGP